MVEGFEGTEVQGHSVVVEVPTDDRAKPTSHLRDGVMPALPERGLDLLQLRSQPLSHGQPQHRETSFSRLPTYVREAEKGERLGLAPSAPLPVRRRAAAEFKESGLIGVQFQLVGREALAEVLPEPLGFPFVLEAHDEVIGITDHDHVTFRLPTPVADPKVEHVVQVDVRKKRRDDAPLRRTHITARPLPVRQYAGAQPFLDEPHDAPVRYPVLDELHQAFVVDGIKETPNVRIQHPVHVLSMDPDTECIQCVVRPASWPEPIREAEEVRLVDAVQDRRERTLDQFVLERGNSERPLAYVRHVSPSTPGAASRLRQTYASRRLSMS